MLRVRKASPLVERNRRIVVIGNGMVSQRLCQALVRHGLVGAHNVLVLGEEPSPAYDRIRLSESLEQPVDDLLLAPRSWYEEAGIALRTESRALAIDRDAREVELEGGERVAYDLLVLATGSAPFVPPSVALPAGSAASQLHVFRDYADLEGLRAAAQCGLRFAILGGGLLGIETAKVLRDRGCAIHLLEAGGHLMSRQLDPDSAAIVDKHVRSLGIETHLSCMTESLSLAEPDAFSSTPLTLRFRGKDDTLTVDHVVVAAGVRPRDELARECGLDVGVRGGVLIDEGLRTSDTAIFAIGECACFKGTCYGLVSPGYAMADALAAILAGKKARFHGSDMSCKLKLLGLPVSALGAYDQEAELVGVDVEGGRRTLMLDGRRLVGATAVGPWPQMPRVHEAIERGARLSQSQLQRFKAEGEVFGGADLVTVESWPAATVICNCENISRGQLSACIANGCKDIGALAEATRAGTVCGSCKPLLAQMVGERPPASQPVGRISVLVISALSLFLASGYVLLKPVPFASSVQVAMHALDRFWRDDVLKQWTGYGLVGIAVLGGLLSARKRLRWFSFGSFGAYRTLHTLTGLLATAGLLAHTGMRFGSNFNFALMALFVGLVAVGAGAGVATSLEANPSGAWAQRARRWRRPLTWGHMLLFWPLPLLLGLHVFAVYYF